MDRETLSTVAACVAALVVVSVIIILGERDMRRKSRELDAELQRELDWWDRWQADRAARRARQAGDDCQGPR